jgi:hypothetical protein
MVGSIGISNRSFGDTWWILIINHIKDIMNLVINSAIYFIMNGVYHRLDLVDNYLIYIGYIFKIFLQR